MITVNPEKLDTELFLDDLQGRGRWVEKPLEGNRKRTQDRAGLGRPKNRYPSLQEPVPMNSFW